MSREIGPNASGKRNRNGRRTRSPMPWSHRIDHLSTPLAPHVGQVTLMGRLRGMVSLVPHFWHFIVIISETTPAVAAAPGAAAGLWGAMGGC